MKILSLMFVGLISLMHFDAWGVKVDSDQKNVWGALMLKCPTTSKFTNADGCLSDCDTTEVKPSFGKTMMVAFDINEHGARFCPTYITSDRDSNSKRPDTRYHMAESSSFDDCVWLCRDGWGGDECQTSISLNAPGCDDTPLKKDDYFIDKASVSSNVDNDVKYYTSDVEDKITAFETGYYDCNAKRFDQSPSGKRQEHDSVLGIVGWLDSDNPHGAFVSSITVHAWCGEYKNDDDCRINIRPEGKKHLLCKTGYKPNSDDTDCIAIDPEACANIQMCEGWYAAAFADTTIYKRTTETVNDKSCYQYRCAVGNYGFKQGTKECIECVDTETQKATYLEDTGECVFTDVSVKPTVKEDGTLEIEPRNQTTRSELSTAVNGDGKPCWMVAETIGEYKKCITGTTSN